MAWSLRINYPNAVCHFIEKRVIIPVRCLSTARSVSYRSGADLKRRIQGQTKIKKAV